MQSSPIMDEKKYYSKSINVNKLEKFLSQLTRAPMTIKLLGEAKNEAYKAQLRDDFLTLEFWNSIILKYKSGLEADLNDDQIAKIFFNVILK